MISDLLVVLVLLLVLAVPVVHVIPCAMFSDIAKDCVYNAKNQPSQNWGEMVHRKVFNHCFGFLLVSFGKCDQTISQNFCSFRFLHSQIHKLLTTLLMTFFYLCIPKFVAVDPMHRMDMPVRVHYISVNTIMLKTRVPSPHRIVLIFCNKLDVMRSGDTIVTWR